MLQRLSSLELEGCMSVREVRMHGPENFYQAIVCVRGDRTLKYTDEQRSILQHSSTI